MSARGKHDVEVDGRRLALSNLDKVLYPSGFTKGQVIDYYVRVSGWLLPHIHDRPITFKRYPNGITGKHFYQKDAASYKPVWIETFTVDRRGGGSKIHYVILNDLPSLIWSANLANLEIHPFLARAPEIERPDFMVFDLDPGEGADILACGEVAFLLKNALARMGFDSFPKVSGSKGIQVYVPVRTSTTYAETRPLARSIAESIEREHPDLALSAMAKAARRSKVFIDWSQNADFKTTVAVYSLRAKRETPYAAMPVEWSEIRRAMRKRDPASLYFEPEAALRRLDKTGDLFAPLLRTRLKATGHTKAGGTR